jgi:hypothetical protein
VSKLILLKKEFFIKMEIYIKNHVTTLVEVLLILIGKHEPGALVGVSTSEVSQRNSRAPDEEQHGPE